MVDWSQAKVLIVEDSATQALLLKKELEKKNLQVFLAKNGKEGLVSLEKELPNLIISDVTMPEMNGFEFCQKVRENPKMNALPIILYTALYDPHEVLNAIKSGANYFLTKPCPIEMIMEFIEDHLKMPQNPAAPQELQIFYRGEEHKFSVDYGHVATLLLSTYGNAVEKNRALEIARRDLKESNVKLQMLNDQKNAFIGMAAHDLRSPLGVVQSYAELLSEMLQGKIEPDLFEMIKTIRYSTERILQIVNEFLDMSVIESGNLKLEFQDVNLKEVFGKNIQMSKNIAQKKEMQLNLQVEGEIPPVYCDGKKIEQVLTNFVTNAIKYAPPKTTITVVLKVIGDKVQFSVQDQGQGIAKEEQGKLFKHFSKTSSKTTGGESSTGLGLAIVKRIIDAHHGNVYIKSEPNKGSTFFVELPLHREPEKP